MAVDYFLKVGDIEGESTDKEFKHNIDIESFSWGVSNPGSAPGGGGGGAGKASFQDFSFVTKVAKASPELLLASASGKHIDKAVLTGRRAGERQFTFLKVTLTDVLVSSYQEAGGEADVPIDSFSLNFSKIEVEYLSQGGKAEQISSKAGWDLKANKKL